MENSNQETETNIKEIVFSGENEKSFCDIFIYEPENIEEKSLGSLYIIGEIVNLPENSSYIVNLLASIIKKEFYSNKKRTGLEALEAGLNKANSTLSDLAERGNIEWIGNLNMACAVHSQKELHLSQAGKIKTLLIRNGQISDIGKNVILGKNPHPFRTFANIASGELEINDLVLFATPELFKVLLLEQISKLSTSLDFESFTNKIQELVSQDESINTLAALLVNIEKKDEEIRLPHTKINALSGIAPEKKSEYAFENDQADENIGETIPKSAQDGAKKISLEDIIKEYEEKNNLNYNERIDPGMQQMQSPDKSAGSIEKIETYIEKIEQETMKEKYAEKERQGGAIKSGKNVFWGRLKDAGKKISAVISGLFKKTAERSKNFKIKLPEIGITQRLKLIQNSKIIFAAFILVAIVFVGNLVITNYSKQIEEERSKYSDLIVQSKAKIDEAEQILIYNDSEKARIALADAQKMAMEVKNNYKSLSGEANLLLEKIGLEIDKIDKVIRITDPKVILDLSKYEKISGVENIIKFNGKYYAISKDNSLCQIDIEKGSMDEIQLALKSIGSDPGNARLATTLSKTGEIIILTDNGKVIAFDPKKTSLEVQKITLGGESANIKGLASYNSFIYLLDPASNQIYKHQRTSTGFNNATKWLPENNTVDIRNAVSLAIDATIYILKSDGEIEKYLTGNKQKFSVEALKNPVMNPTLLYTETDLNNLYVADPQKNRIVIFEKTTGNMIKQYIVKDMMNDIKNITVDDKEENIYVLGNNKIFKLGIKE